MSATPDRPDKENIYELFDYNIALDIRLKDVLENNLLCPFHYFRIADITIDGNTIQEESDSSTNKKGYLRLYHILTPTIPVLI